ncbi:MAG TPA: hypothetical protein ENK19_05215 [Acidobacteria bacterium]|nr:hypothetical protein [Acidobacteriota bacterium]
MLALLLASLIVAGLTVADELVDDFETPARWQAWSFSNGPEFPGARGELERVPGAGLDGSTAARLGFDFTEGGQYVAAVRTLEDVAPSEGISFRLRGAVAGTRLFVRLVDESQQTFQTYLPMQSEDPQVWVTYRVLAGGSGEWWGGAGDGVFHGHATALAIVVDAGYRVHTTGAVLLDDVVSLSSNRVSLDPFSTTRNAPPRSEGKLRDRLGVNIHFTWPDTEQLERAREGGFGWIRTDLFWDQVEQQRGRYDFAPYDALIDAVESRGMRALLILDYFNPLYCDTGACAPQTGPVTGEQRAAFAAFAAAAAAHFDGRAVSLEVWNEPNIPAFWKPAPDAAGYGLLAAETLAAVKRASPEMPVVVGATSGVDVAFLDAALAAADVSAADAVSVHPYRSFMPESIGEDLALARETVSRRTGRTDLPLISGEWGYTALEFGGTDGAALKAQAVAAVRELLSTRLFRLPLAIWYDLTDDCDNPADWECHFGLLRPDGTTPKPAWDAVATMSRMWPGGPVRLSSCGQPPAVFCLAARGVDAAMAVLWTSQENTPVALHLPRYPGGDVLDLFGAVLPVNRDGDLKLTLRAEDGPVYLRVPRGPRPVRRAVPRGAATKPSGVSRTPAERHAPCKPAGCTPRPVIRDRHAWHPGGVIPDEGSSGR